jgi:hypothetical protein
MCADEAPSPDVTIMEKMIVEATRVDDQPGIFRIFGRRTPWLYLELPDYEILSLCDSEQTVNASRHLAYNLAVDEDFIPADHLAPLATPMSFIMFDHEPSKAMEALIPNAIVEADAPTFGIYHDPIGLTAGGRDICDSDTHCSVQNRWGMPWAYAGASLGRGPIPMGLLFRINRCAPALPLWYQYGFIGPCGLLRMAGGSDSAILAAAIWISEAETESLIASCKKTNTLPTLPPIDTLFRRRSSGSSGSLTDWPPATWMAEASLFLRWGLYADRAHRKTFDTFVERSRVEPVTEAMFRGCFGFGFSEMQLQLSRYLIGDARHAILVGYSSLPHWYPDDNPKHTAFPNLTCREATNAEIARLLGDWERMEGEDKKASDPELSRIYFRQAGKTLQRCYDNGERDPRFLAVLGLYDADVGAETEARGILESATKGWVQRPAAYVALARLNFDEAKEHPGIKDGRFDTQQTAAVLRPLFAVRDKARLDALGYRLIADAWLQCVEKPSLSNLAVLREGMGLYPFDSALLLASAVSGHPNPARAGEGVVQNQPL